MFSGGRDRPRRTGHVDVSVGYVDMSTSDVGVAAASGDVW